MDILGFDTVEKKGQWLNSTGTGALATLQDDIDTANTELDTQEKIYKEANENYKKCVYERGMALFGLYSCKNNTDKTQAEWKRIYEAADGKIKKLKSELIKLTANFDEAKRIIQEAAAAGKVVSEAEILENIAYQESGKTAGVWIAVGLGAVAIGFLVFTKIIKKR